MPKSAFSDALNILMSFLGLIIALSIFQTVIQQYGTSNLRVEGLNAFYDFTCTIPCSQIYWGTLYPNETATYPIFLKNNAKTNAVLSMHTENWNPSNASDYLTLTWDAEGKILQSKIPLRVTFTLKVSANITGITNFSFDIVITAQELG